MEDFKKCGGKAGNPYNFPFVSDCVGSSFSSSNCKDTASPVPCGDGTCRSDYVACLRALSDSERRDSLRSSILWAFRRYKDWRTANGDTDSVEGKAGEDAIYAAASASSSSSRDANTKSDEETVETNTPVQAPPTAQQHPEAIAWTRAGDSYMTAIFGNVGKEDKAGGTRKVVQVGEKDNKGGEYGGGRKGRRDGLGNRAKRLNPSSDVHSWGQGKKSSRKDNGGGSIEYNEAGVVEKNKGAEN